MTEPTVTLTKTGKGHSFTATKGEKKVSLFISPDQPVCLKSVMAGLEHFL